LFRAGKNITALAQKLVIFSSSNSAWFAPTGQGVEFTNCPVTEPARVLLDESMVLAGQARTTKFHIRLPNYQERKFTNSKLADILRRRYVMICSDTMLFWIPRWLSVNSRFGRILQVVDCKWK
jgi:hypothetical protein